MSDTPAAPAPAQSPAAPAPAAPAPAPARAAPAPAPAAPAPAGVTYDADTTGWLQNRGYNNLEGINTPAAAAIVKQTRELENLRGVPADKILQIPDDINAPGALDGIYGRLGRPQEAGGYQFPADPAGDETEFRSWASPIFHAAGLNNAQANALYTALKAGAEGEEASATEATNTAQAAAMEALKGEWKDTYDVNVQIARDTVAKLGVDDATIAALEGALNNAGVVKLFAAIGGRTAEAPFVTGSSPGMSGLNTPEAAQQRLNELTSDKDFATKVHSGDTEANALVKNLSKLAAGNRLT